MSTTVAQRRLALARANEVRFGHAAVKRELARGELSLPDALADPRSVAMPLFKVLEACRGRGPSDTMVVHRKTGIDSRRLVGSLTERQKQRVLGAVR